MSEGLSCVCQMPLRWYAADFDDDSRQQQLQEAALLLSAMNQIEGSHELEANHPENRRLDRLEAKLDLTLHLLVRSLHGAGTNAEQADRQPQRLRVELTPVGATWLDATPPLEGNLLIVEFSPSSTLPLSLKLPAIALAPQAGMARVRFDALNEALDEALHQFVFRRHRQAIRTRGG